MKLFRRLAIASLMLSSSLFLSSCDLFSFLSLNFLPTPEDDQMAQKAQEAWNNPNIDLSAVKHKLGKHIFQCYEDAAQISGLDLKFLLAFTQQETEFDPNSICCNHYDQYDKGKKKIICKCDVEQNTIVSIDCGLIQTNSLTLCGIIRNCTTGSRACRSPELFQKANSYSPLSLASSTCAKYHVTLEQNKEYCSMLRGGANKQCASVYTGAYELMDCERYMDIYYNRYKHSPPPPKSSLEYWREVAICYNAGAGNLSYYIRFHTLPPKAQSALGYAKSLIDIMQNLPHVLSDRVKKFFSNP